MGAPNPKPDKVTLDVGGEPLVLYVKIAEVSPMLGALTADAESPPVDYEAVYPNTTRRRWMGGPTITVTGHDKKRVKGGEGKRATLPGNNAYLERPPLSANGSKRVETITFVGPFRVLKDYCLANAASNFDLRSPWGEKFPISSGS